MKLGIMQPYFMPYLGYFSLIKHTDRFILFDTVQYIRHGWIERNRILKPDGGWQYIQVPLVKANGRDTLIKDILINNKENWKEKILSQLQHYKKKAPYYYSVIKMMKEIFTQDYNDITRLNKVSLETVCNFIGFRRSCEVFSEMNLNIDEVKAPDEWALNICKAIDGVEEYWNPIGGMTFFDRHKYEDLAIKLFFQQVELTDYKQIGSPFESGLSIIDVLMFNKPEEVNEMLDKYELL